MTKLIGSRPCMYLHVCLRKMFICIEISSMPVGFSLILPQFVTPMHIYSKDGASGDKTEYAICVCLSIRIVFDRGSKGVMKRNANREKERKCNECNQKAEGKKHETISKKGEKR